MINKMRRVINDLPEHDAKSFLNLIYLKASMTGESGNTEAQTLDGIQEMYQQLLAYHEQKNKEWKTDLKTAHIVFGDSIAGALNITLKQIDSNAEQVINISDNFAVGPISQLSESEGILRRYEWLGNHINFDEEYLENYQDRFKETIDKIIALPAHVSIVIWVGENAHEQTGLRFVLKLLQEKSHNITNINTTKSISRLFDRADRKIISLHTGEVAPDKLQVIYENNLTNPLSMSERERLETEWDDLSTKQELLRTWEKGQVRQVAEDFYDELIMEAVRDIHIKREVVDFIRTPRVIGEVIGQANQYISDSYLEYRVRKLAINGVFDIEGVPKGMRYYSVKLNEGNA